ncbi:hypothetical protein [Actinoplanes solisilvae]|uniref:hypothetical protein n=1 Tax=Actinoplanes solisilvae TaxID=2486853 RepID=UPI000FDC88AB|nr:hypothetical protein [Actinoplanes solisilvae]
MISHSREPCVPTGQGPVLAAILSVLSADDVLRTAFTEADHRCVPLVVQMSAGVTGDETLTESIERWAEKYPHVPFSLSVARGIDPAITLTAATAGSALAVLPAPANTFEAALLRAVTRRARCPVLTALTPGDGSFRPA